MAIQDGLDICVVGAPPVKLPFGDKKGDVQNSSFTSKLCRELGFRFAEIPHDRTQEIASFVNSKSDCRAALVAGARIIKKDVINIFPDGIINFHPGPLPATSGLDSFFWMIKKRAIAGTTAHLVDDRVDAGRWLTFTPAEVSVGDSIEEAQEKIYQSQLRALDRVLSLSDHLDVLHSTQITRPYKNLPMTELEKSETVEIFEEWKSFQVTATAQFHKAMSACKTDNISGLQSLFVEEFSTRTTAEGWNLLTMACVNQSEECVKFLLEAGFDPNFQTLKGTTPLMYAKTKLMNNNCNDWSVVERLLASGADIYLQDIFGKTVLDYVSAELQRRLLQLVRVG